MAKKNTGQKNDNRERKSDRTFWTQDEEQLLMECFIKISEDPKNGNDQAKDTFWYKILDVYNERAEENGWKVRNKKMLTVFTGYQMAQSSNVSSSVVQDVVNGHVFESPNGHVSHLPNGYVLGMTNRHVSEDTFIDSVVSRSIYRYDEDLADGDAILGLLERLRLDNLEKTVCCRLMMKEVELKIVEKNICIGRLRRNGYGLMEATVDVCMAYVSEASMNENYACGIANWEPQFILRCNREKLEDVRLARDINALCMRMSAIVDARVNFVNELDMLEPKDITALCMRMSAIVDERVNFVNELDMLEPKLVMGKMAKFMKEIQDKGIQNLMKL
uniref:Myb/SANT-like domain-containing protein n=1 Tax=Tanacetum cinerariifolium TaxID=118510 RepID=A0A6L2L4Z7_TANCI|nr:hypothetical protein [Tanacetum cinerariifolium]